MTPLSPATLKSIAFLEGIRKDVLSRIEGLTEEEARRVPEGFRNSIHWNVGHILHVQLAHWYVRRGAPLPFDLGGPKYFREGKSPLDYDEDVPAFSRLLRVYREYSTGLAEKFGDFLEAPLAKPFDYMNARFETVADDLSLLVFHDGEHYPILKRLLKALGKA
jgi:uncharacterized damage-inducible protein DinB